MGCDAAATARPRSTFRAARRLQSPVSERRRGRRDPGARRSRATWSASRRERTEKDGMPTFDERRLDVGYDFGPNQGSVSMGENEYGGVPVGYDVGWHGNALPWIPGPLAGSVDAGPFHAEGAVDPSAHLNYGVARNQDGDMTVGLDAQATSGHGEVDVGPVGVGIDGPSADVHASANDNHALVGAGASAVNADVHYDDGTRRGSVGAGVGVGADFGVHYDKDPKDGRRYFGVEGD